MSSDTGFLAAGAEARHRTILKNVYMWMGLGLAITAVVSWWVLSTPAVLNTIFSMGSMGMIVLFIAEIALVAFLSRRVMHMSAGAAVGCFALYSALNGITLTPILLIYTQAVVFQAFAIAAGMFAVTGFWAVVTKKDLSGWGHFLRMGLFGLIIVSIVSFFFQSEMMSILISSAGVVLFTALTAYDTQQIRRMSDSLSSEVGEADYVRLSILGALKLYLDFINLFLFLLRLLGRRR